jgi:hypothetical protein
LLSQAKSSIAQYNHLTSTDFILSGFVQYVIFQPYNALSTATSTGEPTLFIIVLPTFSTHGSLAKCQNHLTSHHIECATLNISSAVPTES